MKNSNIAIIITAAGSSTRMGSGIKKEYLSLNNGTVLSSCAKTFLKTCLNNYNITDFIITCPSGGKEACQKALNQDEELKTFLNEWTKISNKSIEITEGSDTRQKSVFNGLLAVKSKPDLVLIHDGARPFVTSKIIKDTIDAALQFGAAVPGVTPTDTQKQIDESGFVVQHLQRSLLTAVQTPQGFNFTKLLEAHKTAHNDNKEYTDDTEIWGKYCGKVKVVPGDVSNIKITYPGDLQKGCLNMRVGFGYDLHRLVEGRKLILGGVVIPFEKGEDGHSDGDVLFHAITDAVLGASGLGDIGSFFPPEDNKWKDADSAELLKTVMEKVRQEGYKIGNVDCVIKLEKPKFIPYRQQVIDSVAKALGCSSNQVFVKAKTGEKLAPIGTSEAVEAEVVCLLEK